MIQPLELIHKISNPLSTERKRKQPTKSRRQRRSEERDRVKANKLNEQKNDRLSA